MKPAARGLFAFTVFIYFSFLLSGCGSTAGKNSVPGSPVALSLTATPMTIAPGQTATLNWSVPNGAASSLAINGICTTCSLPTGSAPTPPLTSTTTYTATITDSAGRAATAAATVTVTSSLPGPLKHIFVLVQENRSFDNYFGALGAYRSSRLQQAGISDAQTVDAFNPNLALTNHNTGASAKPFHEPTVCTEDLSAAWDESHHDAALSGGDPAWSTTSSFNAGLFAMNNFLDTTASVTQNYDPNGTRAVGFYDQTDIPYYYDLATFFATSDAWFSPVLAGTVPNRMFLIAGSSFGHEYPDLTGHPLYAAPTIFRAMNQANVSWLYYYRDDVFLANFRDSQDPAIQPKILPITDLLSRLGGSCSGAACDADSSLPEVVFIDSASGSSQLDEHPGNNIQSGAAYVQSLIAALMQSDAWSDSALILTYDEGGGLYDHVAPIPVPAPDSLGPGQCPDPNNGSSQYCRVGTISGGFNLSGFRVPLMVVSPFAKAHFVSHTARDYTAILAFIENTFNVPALTARDAFWKQQGDMQEFFDFSAAASLNPPGGSAWTQFLNSQPTGGVCDPTKEAG
ncbi:MAG: hypothetical protein JO041_14915 [Acidobacteria bacterium]|nr:hypothetical protein [Acidobacteriota bacterium]